MAPYSLLVTRLQVSELGAPWVHGGGVPNSLPAAVGEAVPAGPAGADVCLPVTAVGPAAARRSRARGQGVPAPSALRPCPRPAASVGGSRGGRVKDKDTSF